MLDGKKPLTGLLICNKQSKLKILQLTPPPERKAGRIVEGETPEAKAAELAKLLHEEAKVV